jgi:membrane fusion protein (multidrug efflux system)
VGQVVKVRVDLSTRRQISRINPSVEPQSRTFELEALLQNRDGKLKPGFFARASVASSHVDEALLIPQEALRYLYGVYKVFTVEKGKLRETEVKLGARDGDEVEVVDGLEEGAQVAVPVAGEELRDGAPVQAQDQAAGKAAQ